MPKSLESLEQQRASIANQIASLGDLRCGSITSTTGRCGKLNCHCHQPKDPGHCPNLRLTYKVEGKDGNSFRMRSSKAVRTASAAPLCLYPPLRKASHSPSGFGFADSSRFRSSAT